MSGTVIITKHSTSTAQPIADALAVGELAYSFSSKKLFIGKDFSGTVNPVELGGVLYTDMLDHAAGTLTASSAIVVDANSKIDHLIIDNLDINGNSIISTDTNGNINLTPNGSGYVVLDGLNYPRADGTASQFLQTDGSGNLTFATVISSFTIAADTGTDDTVNTGETLTFTGGDGVDTAVTNNVITITGETATYTNKGVASFNTNDFTLSSGAVSLDDDILRDITTDSGAITMAGHAISVLGGEGLNVTHSGTVITVAGEDASTTNKGVASFNSSHFVTSAGAVTIAADAIDNTLIDFGSGSGQVDTDDLPEGSINLWYTDERVDDRVNGLFVAGEGIDLTYNDAAGTFTITGEDATASNKGVASFATADFAVASGAVTIKAAGVSNTQLVNDGITIGSDDTSLGGTITDLNGITSLDVDNITIDGNAITTTDSNGNLDLSPNGSGTVTVPSGYQGRAGFTSDSLANKAYVDSVANGLDVKASVRVATTANLGAVYNNAAGTLTNSGSQAAISVDGVTLVVTNRVLVKSQTTQAQNGFYKVTTVGTASTNWVLTRTPDADAASELTAGAFTFAEEGTLNGDNGYVMSTDGAVTLGTTAITFEQFSGAGQITAGNGLTKNGNTIDAVGTADKITVSADAITIASTYIGQNTITTVGTIGTGTWAATDVAVAHGGTGASTALAARTNLGVGEGDSPMLTAIEVGHATDSTLARASAGDLSIEGNIIYRAGGTDIAIADGGTGLSSFTADAVMISNSAGNGISFIDVSGAQSEYNLIGFNSAGVPLAVTTIDGGTF